MRTHAHAVVAYFTRGRTKFEQNGEWTLRAGDVVLVPSAMPHRMIEAKSQSFIGLRFCVSCVAANGGAGLLVPFERVREGGAAVVQIPAARRAYFETLFRELTVAGYDGRDDVNAADAVQRSLLTLILAEVETAMSRVGPASAKASIVSDALRYIERRCLDRITLADVAKAVKRSPAYLTTAVSRATGKTVGEWIISGRLAEARRQLLHSDESIDEIAGRVGYADATHFIRMFRREHGATPAAWRTARTKDQR